MNIVVIQLNLNTYIKLEHYIKVIVLASPYAKLKYDCYRKIDYYFLQNGFKMRNNEPTLYLKKEGEHNILMVCLYVDDIIYMGSSNSLVTEFKNCMMNKFEMSDLGLLHYFLGLEVKYGSD